LAQCLRGNVGRALALLFDVAQIQRRLLLAVALSGHSYIYRLPVLPDPALQTALNVSFQLFRGKPLPIWREPPSFMPLPTWRARALGADFSPFSVDFWVGLILQSLKNNCIKAKENVTYNLNM